MVGVSTQLIHKPHTAAVNTLLIVKILDEQVSGGVLALSLVPLRKTILQTTNTSSSLAANVIVVFLVRLSS